MQGSLPCLWALVNPKAKLEEREIELHGTGNPIWHLTEKTERKYIGSVQTDVFVWHVFERIS